MLKVIGLKKSYPTASGELAILNGVDLELSSGETVAIIGPSGSGKSTLLNIIGTLDRPNAGEIQLAGRDMTRLSDLQLAEVRNRDIGFIFQAHHLLPQCTVLENVLVPTIASEDKELRKGASARAQGLLERVGLGSRLHHRPGELSGGERQRVAVVRALINRPKLLLADEPTGALDRVSAAILARLLIELNTEENTSLIVVTHALDLASQMGKTYELQDGKLVQIASPFR